MAPYLIEPVDELPFASAEKSRRYATERYQGAVGRNWYTSDPTLQLVLLRHLGADGLAWADPAPRAARRAHGRPGRRAGRGDRPEPAPAREVRPLGPGCQPGGHAAHLRGVAARPRGQQLQLPGLRRRGPAGRRRSSAAGRGLGVPARPGRDRDDVRARHRRRHGHPPRRGVRPRRRQGPGAGDLRRRRDGGRGGPDAHRAHGRLRPRGAGDDRRAATATPGS